MLKMQGVGVLLGVLLVTGTAAAEQVEERHTHTKFQVRRNIGGQPYILVGMGARRAAGLINVYGAGMYISEKQGVAAWQSYLTGRFAKAGLVTDGRPDFGKLPGTPAARHFIVYGRFARLIDMAFTRNVSAKQISGAYNESWDRVNLDRAAAGEALTQFMAAVNHDVQSGQRMTLRTAGNNVWVNMPSGTTHVRANRALVVAIWKIWFGRPCLQRPLRDGMLSDLERVHSLATQ